jgi:hypothetical protein
MRHFGSEFFRQGFNCCFDCGAPLVVTLFGGLTLKPEQIAKLRLSPSEKTASLESVRLLGKFALLHYGRELDRQTEEDIPKLLCGLRDDLQLRIEGLGEFPDLDAALFLPLTEAVETLRKVPQRAVATESPQAGATDGQLRAIRQPSAETRVSAKAVEALLGDDARKIVDITRSSESADTKMRNICAIDLRFLAWDSEQWSELLGVTAAAIRKTHFWRKDRQPAIDADKELRGD